MIYPNKYTGRNDNDDESEAGEVKPGRKGKYNGDGIHSVILCIQYTFLMTKLQSVWA